MARLDPAAAAASSLRQQGDAEFAKMHWCGWKNAADLYQKALIKRDEPELRQRLFSAYILLSLRETELSFQNESWVQKAEKLLPQLTAEPFDTYLAMAREELSHISLVRSGYTMPWKSELEKKTLSGIPKTAMSDYLRLRLQQLITDRDHVEKLIAEKNEFRRLHGDSNLAVYLRSWTLQEMDEKLAAYPEFAEMVMLRGDWHNSGKQYQEALADYQQALEAMPVLFKASNAMATLYYSLEEYEQALPQYKRTLQIVPLEPTALFGCAICLSEMKRYDESDRVLNEMIAQQSFYHGEANYYLAKNSYYRQRPEETRSYLNRAAAYIPDSPEMNMLSGLLYLDHGQPGQAATDFQKVLEQQPDHAEAWYFLGQAALQEKKLKEARSHFLKAVANFRREWDDFNAKLMKMNREKDADTYQRNYYVKRKRQREEYAREAIERLTPLQKTFRNPLLAGLRELLAALAAPPVE
jgi:tetratricopeptide (TPR) repeat protein